MSESHSRYCGDNGASTELSSSEKAGVMKKAAAIMMDNMNRKYLRIMITPLLEKFM